MAREVATGSACLSMIRMGMPCRDNSSAAVESGRPGAGDQNLARHEVLHARMISPVDREGCLPAEMGIRHADHPGRVLVGRSFP